MILIYQMLKVASRSWMEAARDASALEGTEPRHVHFLSQRTLGMLGRLREAPPEQQTIANPFMLRDMLRKGAQARAAINIAHDQGEKIHVISGMRDPVARSLSLVHFFADFYGDTSRKLNRATGGTGADTAAAVIEFWQAALNGVEPADSFGRLLTFLVGAYRSWFADELEDVLGIGIGEEVFPAGGGAQCITTDHAKLLLYRVEDLAPQARGHGGLLAAAADFLGTPIAAIPQVNTAASRRSYERFKAAQAALRLPPDMLDAIYDAPIIRRFYSPAETEVFRQRWGIGRP